MAVIIFFILNSFEAFLVAFFLYTQGSISSGTLFNNLSAFRLILVLIIGLIGFLFLVLSFYAFSKKDGQNKLLTSIFQKSKVVFALIFFMLFVLGFLLLLLSTRPEFFKNLQAAFIRFEPILAWLTIIVAQTLFVVICCFIAFQILNKKSGSTHSMTDLNIPTLIFTAMVIVKLLFITSTAYGPSISDEKEYYDLTFYLDQGNLFQIKDAFHSPFLYAVALLPAMPFSQYTFDVIKLINVLLSSSAVFPIYFLARRFIDPKKAAAMTILCCLMPFHLVIPRRIQSENLYYPLFMWSVLFVFSDPKDEHHQTIWDILNGISLGALYLTRYITLAALPAFFLAWWVKRLPGHFNFKKISKQVLLQFVFLTSTAVLTFSPWLIMGFSQKVPLKELVGFGIASRVGDASHLTLQNMLIWAVLYACYYILIASPFLPILLGSLTLFFKNITSPLIKQWMILMGLLTGAYGAAVVRHSWRAYYNTEIISKIMGRYLIFFGPLFLLTAFISFSKENLKDKSSTKKVVVTTLASSALVLFAWLVFIANSVFKTDGALFKALGSIDGYYVEILGSVFLIMIGGIYLILAGIQIWKKQILWAAAVVLIALFYSVGIPRYSNELVIDQIYTLAGKNIAEAIIRDIGADRMSEPINLYLPNSVDSRKNNEIGMSVAVRGLKAFSPYTFDVNTWPQNRNPEGYTLLPAGLLQESETHVLITVEIDASQFALIENKK